MITSSCRPDARDIPPALLDPEPTADKRVRRYNAALTARGRRPRQPRREIPGLDVGALSARYGAGDAQNLTQIRLGTFRVPIGISWDQWTAFRNLAATRFLKALEDQGWQVSKLTARPGRYPYPDVLSGVEDPDFREMQLVAECGLTKEPEAVVVALDPEDVTPIVQTR